jgi:hypothetical protein
MNKRILLRTADSLPKWFPLRIYSTRLTAQQWLDALVMRWVVRNEYQNTHDECGARDTFERLIVRQPARKSGRSRFIDRSRKPGELLGVRELPAFDAAYIATMFAHSKSGAALLAEVTHIRKTRDSRSLWIEPSPRVKNSRRESFADMVNHGTEPYRMPDVLSGIPVAVDIDQDDESLMSAFKFWLANARSILGPARRPIGAQDFSSWRDYGVLPVFDLRLWGELHHVRYSETLIADTLWPDAEFDSAERLRKVTRPKIKELFDDWALVGRFWRQLELEASFEKIAGQLERRPRVPAI